MEVWEAHDTIGAKRVSTRMDKPADLLGADHELSVLADAHDRLHKVRGDGRSQM